MVEHCGYIRLYPAARTSLLHAHHITDHPTSGVVQHPLRGFSLLTILRRNQRENPRHPLTLAHPLSRHPSVSPRRHRRSRSRSRSPTSTLSSSSSASDLTATHPLFALPTLPSASLTPTACLPWHASIRTSIYLSISMHWVSVRKPASISPLE